VTVQNVDEVPVLTAASVTVNENQTGALIATATNPDNGTLVWSLSGDDASLFSISATGVVTFNTAPDYEKPQDANKDNKYELIIGVKDNEALVVTQPVTVTVQNVNEYPTSIILSNNTIGENKVVGSFIGNLTGADPDNGDALSFILKSGVSDNANFQIIQNGTTWVLQSNVIFDYETQNQYTVSITVQDGNGGEFTKAFLIDVVDDNERPTAYTSASFAIDENAPAQSFASVLTATDVEAVTATNNLTWTIDSVSAGVGVKADSKWLSYFAITPSNAPGVLSKSASLSLIKQAPDYESGAHQLLVYYHVSDKPYVVSQNSMSSDEVAATVLINDVNEAPTALALSHLSIDENQVANTLVGAFTPTDPDGIPQTFTYTLAGSGADFNIVDNKLLTSRAFDFEKEQAFPITVTVTDQGGLSFTQAFTITINDVNEAPALAAIGVQNINEDSVWAITALGSDVDAADKNALKYSLTTNVPVVGLSIDSISGVISWTPVNEQVGTYSVIAHVRDLSGLVADQPFTINVINVNDPPIIAAIDSQSTFQGQAFSYQVIAKDRDLLVPSANEKLTYSLVNPYAGLTINHDSGLISFTSSNSDVGNHSVTVVVSDRLGLADTGTFTLTVKNVNDAPTIEVIRDTSVLQDQNIVIQPVAHDIDSLVAVEHESWSLIHGPVGLTIDSLTGAMTWTPGNADVGDHSVTVQVKDLGDSIAQRSFVLTVINVNDPPVILPATFTVAEDAAIGTVIGKVTGSDPDVGSSISYTAAGGSSHFSVNADGSILVSAPLDYEAAPVESLWVAVSDGQLKATALMIVNITNVLEASTVKIIKVVAGDSVWTTKLDTVWTNQSAVDVTWTRDGESLTETSTVQPGINVIIKEYKGSTKDLYGRDTVVVVVSTKIPDVEILLPPVRPEPVPNVIVENPKDSLLDTIPAVTQAGDSVYFINASEQIINARVIEVGKDLKLDTIIVKLQPTLTEGLNTVNYTWTDEYGNSQTGTIHVYLDTIPPIVKILKPKDSTTTSLYVVPVVWTVNGHLMDTLNMQTLVVGPNMIVRGYRDRAGNVGYDTVYITLKDNSKDIHLDLEQSLVLQDSRKTSLYYSENPPKSDELFALSLVNTQTGTEEKVLYGSGAKAETADGSEPYPGHAGKHLGPTLRIDVKLPQMGGVDAAGNARGGDIQSLVQHDGLISLSAGSKSDSELTVSEYVQNHCLADAFDSLTAAELLTSSIYKSQLVLEVSIYDGLGQFVDNMNVTQKINNSKYLNDGGVLTAFFEIKPSADGGLRSQSGREYGTGAYVIRGAVRSISTLQCDLPGIARGERITYASEMLQKFGYRRDK